MSKLVSRDFYHARVQDHEAAAAECSDPLMRELWRLTAAEWREVSRKRTPARRRKPKRNDTLASPSWSDFLSSARNAGAEAVFDFRSRDQIELILAHSLLIGWLVGPETSLALEAGDMFASPESTGVPTIQDFDLIL